MNVMAVPHSDDDAPVTRTRSAKNRQISVYASRIKPSIAPFDFSGRLSDGSAVEDVPALPPLPISPRWDSLQNGVHLLHTALPSRPPPSQPNQSPEAQLYIAPPPFSYPQPLDAALADMANDSSYSQPSSPRTSPPRPVTAKSSIADLRKHDSGGLVENFSRPRKHSIKQPILESERPRLTGSPPSDPVEEIANTTPQTPPRQRSRAHSGSSNKSSSTFASPLPPPVVDIAEPKLPRGRNAIPAAPMPITPLPGARPPFGNRVDSSASAPVTAGPAPWMSGDELRSSFRSQLTASTAPGTAATERSSVLTKDSSVSSLYANADEPSLEDVMHMYEKGFHDDDEAAHSDSDDHFDSRPVTFTSEPGLQLNGGEVLSDYASIPPVPLVPPAVAIAATSMLAPESSSNLDAEIRRSKLIFTSPDFTSSVPAISNNLEISFPEKRDSSRSLASDPSVSSDPTLNVSSHVESISSVPIITTPSPSISPSHTPANMPRSEPEDPGSRDRYGFKKQSQFVTKPQYDEWNKGYSQYLARRRRKWIGYLKDSALMTERPIRFPAPNAKTKRFVRKGIPPDWRGAAWFYYAGGPAILAKHSGLYEKLLYKKAKQIDIEAIERDLHRTFPDNIQFKPSEDMYTSTTTSSERASQSTMTGSTSSDIHPGPPGTEGEPPIITSLRRVLHAFSVYNPRIGYCQSLNFLAGLLLLFVETEEHCFWLLNVITRIYLPGTHEMSLEGSKVDLGVLMTELRDTMPAVWDKIGGELEGEPDGRPSTSKSARRPKPRLKRKDMPGLSTERLPPITLCMTAWFMSCFIGTLPIETTLRVWDVFFYEGSKTLFRIALSIFKLGEAEIKAVSDPMEMFGVVQSMPRRMLDANALMDACFKRRNGFGHLSQDAIEERRQERRDQTQIDRDMQLQRGKSVTANSNVTEGDTDHLKKGTLFGIKKRDGSRTRATEA